MKASEYLGEVLWLGNLGHIMVVLATIAAITAAFLYFRSTNTGNDEYRQWARKVFYLQAFSVLSIFLLLFYIIFSHRYEYYYAWRHSSNTLPLKYMISCFWEGQEGSFLLWMFWNAVIGIILTRRARDFEAPVMAVVCFAQFALATMLLGVHLGDMKIGSSPFELLRIERPDMLAIPVLAMRGVENYLTVYTNGNGLNQLLQNPWMVIHPPTLFFGFASAIVPFAYSIAALWTGKTRAWLQPALIWALVCVCVLGGGIMMGGWWAYESLTFGGYWAWDPVENASLLPWLIMVTGMHMLLINKSTNRHGFTAHLLIQLSFWLVLYATFLTRSGILGESSVHSFTDLGLSGQLLLFLFAFIILSIMPLLPGKKSRQYLLGGFLLWILGWILLLKLSNPISAADLNKWAININVVVFLASLGTYLYLLFRKTRSDMEDEKWLSREFWMFLGNMFLILSLVQIFTATSMPVFNKVFGTSSAPQKPEFYNYWQLWLSLPIMLLMGVGQHFRYKDTPKKALGRDLAITGAIALALAAALVPLLGIGDIRYMGFLFLALALIAGNVLYYIRQRKQPWLQFGASVAHAGFGILLIGVLISSVNKKILTESAGIDMAPETDAKGKIDQKGVQFNRENLIAYRNKPIQIGDYRVTYRNFHIGGVDSIDKYFDVFFEKIKDGEIVDTFSLMPSTQDNPKMGLLAEPSTRHFAGRDIFTHLNYESGQDRPEPYGGFKTDTIRVGSTVLSSSGKVKLSLIGIDKSEAANLSLRLALRAQRLNDTALMFPIFAVRPGDEERPFETLPAEEPGLGIMVNIVNVIPEGEGAAFIIQTAEKSPVKEYIVIKAIEFPGINLVWAGTIIMVLGSALAIYNRSKQYRQQKQA